MKKTLTLLSIASVLLLGACKKDKTTDPEPDTPVTPTEEPLNGSLTMITQKDISGTMPDYIFATAFFYDNPHATSYIKVDSVIANNVGLQYQSFTGFYQSTYNVITDVTKANWDVRGNNGIPSFTYLNKTGMPVYTGYTAIPNTLNSAKDYTLTLTGLSNTDLFVVMIRDGYGVSLSKSVENAKTTTSVTFTATELQTLDTDAVIQVTVLNNHYETVGTKRFSIQNEGNYYKDITIN
jgi:hypothetical protein